MFMLIILVLEVGEMDAAIGLTLFIIADKIAACMSVASIEMNEWVERICRRFTRAIRSNN